MATVSIATAIVCSFGVSPAHAKPEEMPRTCVGVDVISIGVSTETDVDWPLSTTAGIEVALEVSSTPEGAGKTLTVIAYGPILGSAMNSTAVKTSLACTLKGFSLDATITNFGDDDAGKNALWRSRISLNLVLREDTVFQTTWRMRWPNGTEIDRAQTPPYPDQHYPLAVTKTLQVTLGSK